MKKVFVLLVLLFFSVSLIGCKKINTITYTELTNIEYIDLVSNLETINKIEDDFYNNFIKFEIETVGKYSYLTLYFFENDISISLEYSLIKNNSKHHNLNFSWEGMDKNQTTSAYIYFNNTNIVIYLDYFKDYETTPYQLLFKARI